MALTTVRAMQKSHRRHDYHSNSEVPGAIRRRWRPAWRCIHHAGVFPHPGETGHILPDLKRQGRDRRARRFRYKHVSDRPAVGPYHTMLEIPMKEEQCSARILSSGADNVWPHWTFPIFSAGALNVPQGVQRSRCLLPPTVIPARSAVPEASASCLPRQEPPPVVGTIPRRSA